MIRAMTAFCAVATAFACFPEAALARATHSGAPASSFEPAAPRGKDSHDGKRRGQGLRDARAVDPREHHGHSAPETARAVKEAKATSKKSSGEGRFETHDSKNDEDDVLEFEEPGGAPGVTGRSKSVVKLEGGSSHDDHGKLHGKKKKRLVRALPPNASWKPYRREPWRRGYVSVSGHGKSWSGYLVDASGDVIPNARRDLSAALCSWRTGRELLLDEHLMALIADVSDEFGGRTIRVVSGYREHSYAPGSKHKVGQAFDFSVPGVPNEALRDFLRSLGDVGVGYYPNSTHVHLDVRDQPTYWVDYSAPGGHPMYAYDRRVARMTPHQRELAAALDVLATQRTPLGRPATESVQRRAPLVAAADPTRAKSWVPLSRAAFAPAPPVFLTADPAEHRAVVPDAGATRALPSTEMEAPTHDAGAPRSAVPASEYDAGRTHDAGPRTDSGAAIR